MLKVALIGRTNVGKSTLFNRLSGTRDALTFDRHGVTRDAKEKIIDIFGNECLIIDTPGMFDDNAGVLEDPIQKRILQVIDDADIILFVVDGSVGITDKDTNIASVIRKRGKKDVILALNKSEKKASQDSLIEALEFGFQHSISISAEHGLGIDELFDVLRQYVNESEVTSDNETIDNDILRLAIIGRPNVGKSTIVNNILQKEVRMVADMNGVTRESCEYTFIHKDQKIKIVDTPGIRRNAKVTDILEKISVSNARKAYRNADAVILVIDSTCLIGGEIEHQDITLAGSIISAGKAVVIAFNKVDLTPYKKNDTPDFIREDIRHSLSQLKNVPFLFISGTGGDNIKKMLDLVIQTYKKQLIEIKTSVLNNWLSDINKSDILQRGSSKFKLKYITQVGKIPPKFIIFVSNMKNIRESHRRYIENSLKNSFSFNEVPIQIFFKENRSKA